MRKRTIIIATLAALLVLVLSPMSVLAQGDEDATASAEPPVKDALAIVAPWVAPVGQEISMRVFLRANQEPFEGAGVWALTQENAEALRAEMAALKEDAGLAAEEPDREALMNIYGTFLGRTGTDGRLYHTFEEAGSYVLVAFTAGYIPGFTHIRVKSMLDALVIEAPRKAEVDEKVTITVYQRSTQDPVKDAGVWALTREQAEALKAEMESIRESGDHAAVQAALEEAVNIRGIFLGTTDGSGKVMYAFTEEGGYLLVAIKLGYLPGLRPIAIGTQFKALGIDAPRGAEMDERVTITVFQRGTLDPVKDAGVWALTREQAESLKAEMESIRKTGDHEAVQAALEEAVNIRGIFLGTTNGSGKVMYAFTEPGGYLLVAFKQGYFPGFVPIGIRAPDTADALESQESTQY